MPDLSSPLDWPQFDTIPSCISAFSSGQFIVVLDSPDRENEGDLLIAAQDVTPQKMAFMVRHSSGLICAPLTPQRAQALDLPQMVGEGRNSDPNRTAYTISVDAEACGRGTGISAADRALTCNVLAEPATKVYDVRRPGHIFPLRARQGGVRDRPGHTEAAVEFCRLGGKEEVGVICELVDDGKDDREGRAERQGAGMMRRDACLGFGKRWGLKVCTIEALVKYLHQSDPGEERGGAEINGTNEGNEGK